MRPVYCWQIRVNIKAGSIRLCVHEQQDYIDADSNLGDEFRVINAAIIWHLGHSGLRRSDLFVHNPAKKRQESEEVAVHGRFCDPVPGHHTLLSLHLLARETKSSEIGGSRDKVVDDGFCIPTQGGRSCHSTHAHHIRMLFALLFAPHARQCDRRQDGPAQSAHRCVDLGLGFRSCQSVHLCCHQQTLPTGLQAATLSKKK